MLSEHEWVILAMPRDVKKYIPTLYIAEELIEDTISRFGDKVVVACSFGKDSMVVSDIARSFNPDIKHIFYNAAPFRETIVYKNMMVEKYNINLTELFPYKGMNFWKCVDKYGLPGFRTSEKGKPHSPRCCYYLKEKPMQVYIRDNDIEAVLTGMTAAESWNRYKLGKKYSRSTRVIDGLRECSQRYWAKTWASWQIHPLMTWTSEDVWEYLRMQDIPVNPVYEKWGGIYERVGCLPCTAYKTWEENLAISHPAVYRKLKEIQTRSS